MGNKHNVLKKETQKDDEEEFLILSSVVIQEKKESKELKELKESQKSWFEPKPKASAVVKKANKKRYYKGNLFQLKNIV